MMPEAWRFAAYQLGRFADDLHALQEQGQAVELDFHNCYANQAAFMKFDNQWMDQVKWNREFRDAHGMETEILLPFVLLMDSDPRLTKLIAHSPSYQVAPMFIGFNSDSAWAIAAPEYDMPQGARDFLSQNDQLS
jgi:hypothetical protein